MVTELNPNDPYDRDHLKDPIRTTIGERRSPVELDNDLQVDPELAEGPASNGRIAMFAVGIAIVLGLVFYALNNTSMTQQNAATTPPANTQKSASTSPPAAPPGMRDVTPRSNSQPGTTTGSAAPAPNPPSAPAKNSGAPANNSK